MVYLKDIGGFNLEILWDAWSQYGPLCLKKIEQRFGAILFLTCPQVIGWLQRTLVKYKTSNLPGTFGVKLQVLKESPLLLKYGLAMAIQQVDTIQDFP